MNDPKATIKAFADNVETELRLCEPADTPYLCAQLKEASNYQKIKKLVMTKVIGERMPISAAIAAIEDELNPNHID